MFCPNCGFKNDDQDRFCVNCGTPLEQRLENPSQVKMTRKKNKKSIIVYILVIVLIAAGCGGGYYFYSKQKKVNKYNALLKEAESYLEDLDYEQAIDTYLKAIEIEPKNVDAYLDLADIYISQYDYDSANEILEKASENVGSNNQAIINKQKEIDGLNEGLYKANYKTSYNGHEYEAWSGFGDVEEAEEFAESIGGHLATITSDKENKVLYQYFVDLDCDTLYFGLVEGDQEGDYSWINGEKSNYENWSDEEPNNDNGGESVGCYYYVYEETWNDGEPRSYSLYIIELE